MNPLQREAAAAAGITAVVGAAAIPIAGPARGIGMLVVAGLACAVGMLWRETHRLRRAQATRIHRIGKRISALERQTRDLDGHLDGHVERLAARLDELGDRLFTEISRQIADADRKGTEDADRRFRDLLDAAVSRMDAGDERVLESIEATAQRSEKVFKHRSREENRVLYAKVDDLLALYHDIVPGRALPSLHGWAVGPDLARLLYREVLDNDRERVLECGSGSTTIVLSYAMRQRGSGHVTSLEHNPDYAALTRRALAERGLAEWATVIDAPLVETDLDGTAWRWYDPSAIPAGPIDLLLVDGPPGPTGPLARFPAMPMLGDRLADDAVVILDDAFRSDEQEIGRRWREAFPGFDSRTVQNDYGALVLRRNSGAGAA